jgi:hypothetical protein
MIRFRNRALAAVFVLPLPLLASLQQAPVTLADVTDPLLHAEIAMQGLYPEMEGSFGEAALIEVPLRSCSSTHAEFRDEGLLVRLEARTVTGAAHTELYSLRILLDDSLLQIPNDEVSGLRDPRFCGFDEGLQRILPFCSVSRSADCYRLYIHLQFGEGRETRVVTWVFDDGRYLFRVEDKAVL